MRISAYRLIYLIQMKLKNVLITAFLATAVFASKAQQAPGVKVWNNKQCAVVLTYDDAIDVDLDNVVPALDSLNLKGTFYLIGSSPVVEKRMAEWRAAGR